MEIAIAVASLACFTIFGFFVLALKQMFDMTEVRRVVNILANRDIFEEEKIKMKNKQKEEIV